jgi:hypothetical protein
MKRLIAILILGAAVAVHAQTPVDSGTPDHPALVSDTNARAADSPLVQLAKRTVAQRRITGTKPMAVITNENVSRSTTVLSTSSGSAAIPDYTSRTAVPTAPQSTPAPTQRATNLGYAAQAAADPTMPQISNNSNTTYGPRTAQNSSDTSALRQATNSASPYSPTTASNSASPYSPQQATNAASPYSPQPATNAGPYRQKQ